MKVVTALAAIWPALLLGACDMAPVYHPPVVDVPAKYKEDGPFARVEAADLVIRGAWWQSFRDRELNRLEPLVETANQDVEAAREAYNVARALTDRAAAQLLPHLRGDGQVTGNRQSDDRPLRGANEPDFYGNNMLDAQASYEVDVWGRIKDLVAARAAGIDASADDYAAIRLSLQGQLARTYFNLRDFDLEVKLLTDTVAAYGDALALTKERLEGKIASPADVSRAEAQLATAQAQLTDLHARRALLEHAIAVLVGQPPSTFSMKPAPVRVALPTYPAGAPSSLLLRRPDVAAAERRVAAQNELIGVARAAFFPRFTINFLGGTQDTGFNLLAAKNILWSIGPSMTLPIFDGGARRADLAAAEAEDERLAAIYRGLFLHSLQEVEDSLALQKWLNREASEIDRAVAANQKTLDVSLNLYREGAVNYLDVVVAQTALLETQRQSLILRTQRLQASLALILALGGGWTPAQTAKLDPS
jgi:outer membrane protein, multidrug efflux system